MFGQIAGIKLQSVPKFVFLNLFSQEQRNFNILSGETIPEGGWNDTS
jgi:hypothetical protein